MINRRAFLSLPAGAAMAQAPKRPNVVVLLADDLGWADVGFHASEIRTPNIDRLASQGAELERFYSFPVCSPTRSALMTGRSPMRLGVAYSVIRPWLNYGLPAGEHLMPQSFRAAGYQTAITGKWHLGHSQAKFMPNSRGFDHAYGHVNGAIDYFDHTREGGLDWHRNGKSVDEKGYSTDLLGAEASAFIRKRDRSRPFFLYVPFNAPHTPLQAPQARLDKYANIADKRRRTFAAMVDGLDTSIGHILSTLDQERVANDTIVLFFSDNGGPVAQAARNTPLRGAKATTWEGGIRVPAVLRWPGKIPAGGKLRQMMAAWDVFPTLSAAAGVKPLNAKPLDGMNLWPQLASGKTIPREEMFFIIEAQSRIMTAVHHREWKLVREETGQPVHHLFRIEEDPNEERNLADRHPEVVKDLAARIDRWKKLHPPDGIRAKEAAPAGWKAPPKWAEAAQSTPE
ncbi:MAG: arylsulfatase [Bryobacteraceae bacterium]|nr:arylsulfatase [Bryobacteraceae bacterium]